MSVTNNKLQAIFDFFTSISFDFNFLSLVIISLFFAVSGNLFSSTILKNIKSKNIIGINFLMINGIMLVLSPFFFKYEFQEEAVVPLLWIIVLDMSANYFYFRIFEKITKPIDSVLISLVSTLIFFLGWLFWGDLLIWQFFFLAIVIILIIPLLYLSWKNFRKIVFLLISSLFLYFVSSLPSQLILVDYKIMNAPTLYMIRAGAIGILSILYSGNLQRLTLKQYKLIFIRDFFIIGQWVTMYTALIKASKNNESLSMVWILGLGVLLLLNWMGIKFFIKYHRH